MLVNVFIFYFALTLLDAFNLQFTIGDLLLVVEELRREYCSPIVGERRQKTHVMRALSFQVLNVVLRDDAMNQSSILEAAK